MVARLPLNDLEQCEQVRDPRWEAAVQVIQGKNIWILEDTGQINLFQHEL